MFEIKQQLEKYLAQELNKTVVEPDSPNPLKFYPAKGGTDEDVNALMGELSPPFGIVAINDAEEIATGTNIYRLEGTVVLISHIEDTGGSEHSLWMARIKAKLDEIQAQASQHTFAPVNFSFALHGIDIARNRSSDSPEDKAHAEAYGFVAGATQLPELTPA